jgi:hypothetical protein
MRLVQEDPNGAGFYQVSQEYVIHLAETYGDRIQIEKTVNGNSVSTQMTFADDATRLQYEADPVVIAERRLREEYNAAHGLVTRKIFD